MQNYELYTVYRIKRSKRNLYIVVYKKVTKNINVCSEKLSCPNDWNLLLLYE